MAIETKKNKSSQQMKVAHSLALLRFDAIKKSGGVATPKVKKKLKELYLSMAKKAVREGKLLSFTRGKKIAAGLISVEDSQSFFGVKARVLVLDVKLKDARALKWLLGTLKEEKSSLDDNTFIFLAASYANFLPELFELGFSVDSLILEGDPKKALKLLKRNLNPPEDLRHLGLSIRRAEKKDISKILKLSKTEFTRNPQFGWFCASPKFLKAQRIELTRGMRRKDHSHYVIEKGKNFLGYFGSDASREKKLAGITLLFDPAIQGKGAVKTAYYILLKDMVLKNVSDFRGGTSQTPVLKISKIMGRRMVSCLLRFQKSAFPKDHFKSFLKVN